MVTPFRQPTPDAVPRMAWLAGASGLIGAALLPLLLASPHYARVHVLSRRPMPLAAHARLQTHIVDFASLPADLPPPDDVYIALGTTIKVAGSQAAFRQVDFDFVVNTARAGRASGAQRLAVVSALGADSASRVFYNRVKGDMQAAVGELRFASVAIAQPSLLIGDRAALGQPARSAEAWTARLLAPFRGLLPASLRPIGAGAVASSLMQATLAGVPGVLSSRELQAAGHE